MESSQSKTEKFRFIEKFTDHEIQASDFFTYR